MVRATQALPRVVMTRTSTNASASVFSRMNREPALSDAVTEIQEALSQKVENEGTQLSFFPLTLDRIRHLYESGLSEKVDK